MRLPVMLAAFAALLIAMPAAAQKGPPAKPEPLRPDRVSVQDPKMAPAITPVAAMDPENTWLLDLSSGGRVTIRLRPDVAPKMVERIKTLTRQKFYDGLAFFRVNDAPEGMAQGGDPKNNGTGDSGLPDLPAEFSRTPHLRGTVSAARKGAPEGASAEQIAAAHNSANSQFFIMFTPKLAFDQNYTAFGRVVSGMEWVDKMERGEPPANPTRIVHAYIAADNPPEYIAPKVELPAGEEEVTLPGTAPKPQ
jgi:cyclophilin family peptidyl-prolyl cis-trans isomerase